MNLPNKLTIGRICIIPFFIFFYMANFIPFGKIIAIALFIIASFTDLLDGKIARKRNLVTDFGKLMDSLADKLLCTAALLVVVFDGTIPAPYGFLAAIIIISRDLIITSLRGTLGMKGIIFPADYLGKVKAALTMGVLPYIMFMAFNNQINLIKIAWLNTTINVIGYVGLGVVVLLTVVSCINYIVKSAKHIKA